MSNYYDERKRAFSALKESMERQLKLNGTVNIDKLVFDLTERYSVSEKALLKRIEQYLSFNPDLRVDGKEIFSVV